MPGYEICVIHSRTLRRRVWMWKAITAAALLATVAMWGAVLRLAIEWRLL